MNIVVDADDFCIGNTDWEILLDIKLNNPDFKITLFTIMGRVTPEWVEDMKKHDWIQMVPHGWMHETPRECESWNYEISKLYINKISEYNLTKGFKAPGWQISDGMYQALLEEGYWVADQHYNDLRRPKGLKVFYPGDHHFHIGHLGGHNRNALEYHRDFLKNLRGEFIFIG